MTRIPGLGSSMILLNLAFVLITTPPAASQEVIQAYAPSPWEPQISTAVLASETRLYLLALHWGVYGGYLRAQRSQSGIWNIADTFERPLEDPSFSGGLAMNRKHDTVFFGRPGFLSLSENTGSHQDLYYPEVPLADEGDFGFYHIASVGDWVISTAYGKHGQATSNSELWILQYDPSGGWTSHSIVTIPDGAEPVSVSMAVSEDENPVFAVLLDSLDVVVYRVFYDSTAPVQILSLDEGYVGLDAAVQLSLDGSLLSVVYSDEPNSQVRNIAVYDFDGKEYDRGFVTTVVTGYNAWGQSLSFSDDNCLVVIGGVDGTPVYRRTGLKTWELFQEMDLSSVEYPGHASFFGRRLAIVDSQEEPRRGTSGPFTLARAFEVPDSVSCFKPSSDVPDLSSEIVLYVSITLGFVALVGILSFVVMRRKNGDGVSSSEGLLTRSATSSPPSISSVKLSDAASPRSPAGEISQPEIIEAPPPYSEALASASTPAPYSAPPDRQPRKRSSSASSRHHRRRRRESSSSRSSSSRRHGIATTGDLEEGSLTPSAPPPSLGDLRAERETLLAEIDAAREALAIRTNGNNESSSQHPEPSAPASHTVTVPPAVATPDPVMMNLEEEPFSTAFEATVIGFGLESSLAGYIDRLSSDGFVLDDHGVVHRYLLKWKEPDPQDQEEKDESPSFWWILTIVLVGRLFGLVGLGLLLLIIWLVEGSKSSPVKSPRELVPVPRCPQELRLYIRVSDQIWNRNTVNLDEISAYHLPLSSGPVESSPPYDLD